MSTYTGSAARAMEAAIVKAVTAEACARDALALLHKAEPDDETEQVAAELALAFGLLETLMRHRYGNGAYERLRAKWEAVASHKRKDRT